MKREPDGRSLSSHLIPAPPSVPRALVGPSVSLFPHHSRRTAASLLASLSARSLQSLRGLRRDGDGEGMSEEPERRTMRCSVTKEQRNRGRASHGSSLVPTPLVHLVGSSFLCHVGSLPIHSPRRARRTAGGVPRRVAPFGLPPTACTEGRVKGTECRRVMWAVSLSLLSSPAAHITSPRLSHHVHRVGRSDRRERYAIGLPTR